MGVSAAIEGNSRIDRTLLTVNGSDPRACPLSAVIDVHVPTLILPPNRYRQGACTLTTNEAFVELFNRLHAFNRLHGFWVSDENREQSSCAEIGLGGHASAGVMARFVSTGVMVTRTRCGSRRKVSRAWLADAALAIKVKPDHETATNMVVCEP